MSLTAAAKKLHRYMHLWQEYIDYRRDKNARRATAQRHCDGILLWYMFFFYTCIVT